MAPVEISINDALYRCYRARPNADDIVESYIVAGVGSITLARDTGDVVAIAALLGSGKPVLERIAPLIQEGARALERHDD